MAVPIDVSPASGGATVPLKVAAGAARERLIGPHDGRLKLSVRTAPERGKANRAVLRLLADALELPVKDLSIVSGATSPAKIILVRGLSADSLLARIDRALQRN